MEELVGLLVVVAIYGLFGLICSLIARNKGRSPVGWFFIGAVAPCIGLILVLVLPDLKVQEERQQRLAKENRRLKEALRKDRQVSDSRFQETQRRLKAHDLALDLDTEPRLEAGESTELLGAGDPSAALSGDRAAGGDEQAGSEGSTEPREWYYLIGSQQVGPVSLSSLRHLWRDGVVEGGTYVWCEKMDDWSPVDDLPDLRESLRGLA